RGSGRSLDAVERSDPRGRVVGTVVSGEATLLACEPDSIGRSSSNDCAALRPGTMTASAATVTLAWLLALRIALVRSRTPMGTVQPRLLSVALVVANGQIKRLWRRPIDPCEPEGSPQVSGAGSRAGLPKPLAVNLMCRDCINVNVAV